VRLLEETKIGFMQGRLSPLVNGRIQAFPWDHWQEEFKLASENNLKVMEWTLDQNDLHKNPLLTTEGQIKIKQLCSKHNMSIPSLTGDCFMQSPFWKAQGKRRLSLEDDFLKILEACKAIGITFIVVPLVDNGSLETDLQQEELIKTLDNFSALLKKNEQKIVFESDFSPLKLGIFINKLDPELFGINYDIGNSSSLGFIPNQEFRFYGDRILNVHVKDRKYGGTTVPLGEGDANFEEVFELLSLQGYKGNYILQTCRSKDHDHVTPLLKYKKMTLNFIGRTYL
jgi:L-ribulose-5-phosphate 3-epimerase